MQHDPSAYHPSATIPEATNADFTLDSQVLHVYEIQCACCQHITKVSEVFDVTIHRTRQVRRLVPATRIARGYLCQLLLLPKRHIPMCVYCVDTRASNGDVAAVERLASESEWAQTLRRKYAPQPDRKISDPTVSKALNSPRNVPTLEDLL